MNIDWTNLFQTVLPFVPAEYAGDLMLIGTFLVSLCAVLARFIPRPADGSKWQVVYDLVNTIGQNKGHATNATTDTKKN